jgi:hypothetical protein
MCMQCLCYFAGIDVITAEDGACVDRNVVGEDLEEIGGSSSDIDSKSNCTSVSRVAGVIEEESSDATSAHYSWKKEVQHIQLQESGYQNKYIWVQQQQQQICSECPPSPPFAT